MKAANLVDLGKPLLYDGSATPDFGVLAKSFY
jgi:hypothetical protein